MIKLTDLEFRYREGEFRLRIPDLSIDRGSTVAVIGPSGSGKTTLLHLIAGVATPLAGRVITNNVEMTRPGRKRDLRHARAQCLR